MFFRVLVFWSFSSVVFGQIAQDCFESNNSDSFLDRLVAYYGQVNDEAINDSSVATFALDVFEWESCDPQSDHRLYFSIMDEAFENKKLSPFEVYSYAVNLDKLTENDALVLELLRYAADNQYPEAKYSYGVQLLMFPDQMTKNLGLNYILESIDYGYANAAAYLGDLYYFAWHGFTQNKPLALEYYNKSAEMGYTASWYNVAVIGTELDIKVTDDLIGQLDLLYTDDVEVASYLGLHFASLGEFELAIPYFRTAILLGDKNSFFYLGEIYKELYLDTNEEKYRNYGVYLEIADIFNVDAF